MFPLIPIKTLYTERISYEKVAVSVSDELVISRANSAFYHASCSVKPIFVVNKRL